MLNVPDERTKRLLDLADYIENLDPEDYDQRKWCSCICGHILKRECRHSYGTDDMQYASQLIGFPNSLKILNLFQAFPWRFTDQKERIPTTKEAATVIRHLAITGEVDWTVVDRTSTGTKDHDPVIHSMVHDTEPEYV